MGIRKEGQSLFHRALEPCVPRPGAVVRVVERLLVAPLPGSCSFSWPASTPGHNPAFALVRLRLIHKSYPQNSRNIFGFR